MYAIPPHSVVISNPATVAIGDPKQALTQFEQSTYTGVWPHLDKSQILKDMAFRLRYPSLLMSGQTLMREHPVFSGGVAILFNLIRNNPFRYVRLCHSLFETGGFQTLRQRIQASEHLRNSRIDQYWSDKAWKSAASGQTGPVAQATQADQSLECLTHVSPVDWMLLLTLYEAQLSSFPPPTVMPFMPTVIAEHPQMTKPWELKGWFTDIFGYRHVTYHHAHLQPGWCLLQQAKNAIANGGVAIALVNAEQLVRGLKRDSRRHTAPKRQWPVPVSWLRQKQPSQPPDSLRLNCPDSWVTFTHVAHISRWQAATQAQHPIQFTVHLGQELISVHVTRSAFHQSCWGMMLANP